MIIPLFLLLLLAACLTASQVSEGVSNCRTLFASDKDYMKQVYMNENRQADYNAVSCDSWGCHNTSGCCYNGYYASWGWGVWIFVVFFCILFLGLVFLAVATFAVPYYGWNTYCDTPYGYTGPPRYREGCYYVYRGGSFVVVKEKDDK